VISAAAVKGSTASSAAVGNQERHYILVGLTHHPRGTEYLEEFAALVDDAVNF
jgi:hypothetical protein